MALDELDARLRLIAEELAPMMRRAAMDISDHDGHPPSYEQALDEFDALPPGARGPFELMAEWLADQLAEDHAIDADEIA